MKSDDIPLHDIKPLAEITDSTLIWLSFLAVLAAVLMLLAGYLLWKKWRSGRREDRRRVCYDALRNIDLDDAKNAAYAISRFGRCFASDSPRLNEAYDALSTRLSIYKYRRNVPPLDEETRSYYAVFIGMIDV